MSELSRAIREAKKKLRFMRESHINSNLEMFCGSYAEAFKAGAEEAQDQIVKRLLQLNVTGKNVKP